MSRTITAFFDSRSDAENARMRLTQAGIAPSQAQIIDQSHSGSSATGGSSGSSDGQGFWASMKSAFLPDEDHYAYEEGLRRGGYLLCAQVDEARADEAIRILDQEGTVDFDRRQEDWRTEGWSGFTGGNTAGATLASSPAASARSGTVEEEHIPIVEEELRVGKREVARGGARVRSYIREIPVHEQVNLREEHVSIERRPVEQPVAATDLNGSDLLRERSIEMTETAEEAVVAKQARVTEEVVVKKTAEERVEQIDDTVRRTEVEVDQGAQGSGDRSAFGFTDRNASSGHTTTGGAAGAGATGFDSKSPEPQGTGYTDRINKSGL